MNNGYSCARDGHAHLDGGPGVHKGGFFGLNGSKTLPPRALNLWFSNREGGGGRREEQAPLVALCSLIFWTSESK